MTISLRTMIFLVLSLAGANGRGPQKVQNTAAGRRG